MAQTTKPKNNAKTNRLMMRGLVEIQAEMSMGSSEDNIGRLSALCGR